MSETDTRAEDNAKFLVEELVNQKRIIEEMQDRGEDVDEILYEQAPFTDPESEYEDYISEPLSITVKKSVEFLMGTGGPALRIMADFDSFEDHYSVRVEHQDWFKPWEAIPLTGAQEDAVRWYLNLFYVHDYASGELG